MLTGKFHSKKGNRVLPWLWADIYRGVAHAGILLLVISGSKAAGRSQKEIASPVFGRLAITP